MYYASFGILALVLTLIINHNILLKKYSKQTVSLKKKYKLFLISVMIYFVTDILWGILYDNKLKVLVYADTIIYFLMMMISLALWTLFVVDYLNRKSLFSKVLNIMVLSLLVFQIVSLIINFFNPVCFTFDEECTYIPGRFRYITFGSQFIFFFITSIYALLIAFKMNGNARQHHITIAMSGLAMTIFSALQIIFPLFPCYAIGCLMASCLIHVFITEEERKDYNQELGSARLKAYTDSLTGVRSNYAYVEAKENYDSKIVEGSLKELAVIMFDLNDLKVINDTEGHEAGDNYLKVATKLICDTFKHSPVFRIGGDEFIAFLEGVDFENRNQLVKLFDDKVENNLRFHNFVVVSSGMSKYNPDTDKSINAVIIRADRLMYEKKAKLKNKKSQ